MSLVSYTHIADGTAIDGSDVNSPLDTIYNDYNGNIDSNNLADNAVITAKIADGAVTAIKTNFGGNYSTSEVDTGFTWIDGKHIYKKTISTGALPNNITNSVNHSISNIATVFKVYGWATDGTSKIILPFVSTTSNIAISVTTTAIQITSSSDRSGFTTSYITVEYSKTA